MKVNVAAAEGAAPAPATGASGLTKAALVVAAVACVACVAVIGYTAYSASNRPDEAGPPCELLGPNVDHADGACACLGGYSESASGASCVDNNECLSNNGGCDMLCVNTDGSFICDCYDGFERNDNGNNTGCTDTNECLTRNGGCAHNCANTNGSFVCSCDSGYTLNSDGRTCSGSGASCTAGYSVTATGGCADINECLAANGGCSDDCVNLPGSFECRCPLGKDLDTDQVTCSDIDECAVSNGGCSHTCDNTDGGVICSCGTGWVLENNQQTCADVDECFVSNGGCSHICDNSPGSYTCRCWEFFAADGNGQCADIDECSVDNGGCEMNCTNLAPWLECDCDAEGYVLNPDGWSCNCTDAYTMNATGVCVDLDECATETHNCSHYCINAAPYFDCACPTNLTFSNDNYNCNQDVDECLDNNGGCTDVCNNVYGGFECACFPGYEIDVNDVCVDIDECATNNGGCGSICTNLDGSYQCSCDAGQTDIDGDGVRCLIDNADCCDADGCLITSRFGYIKSPNYPSTYPDYMQCVYFISPTAALTVDVAAVEQGEFETGYDNVYFIDGTSGSAPLLLDFTGAGSPQTSSTQPNMLIAMVSDSVYGEKGLWLAFDGVY